MKPIELNGIRVYPFRNFDEIIDFAESNIRPLVAVNAEKILHATPQTRALINAGTGYADGMGAVMALRQHGCSEAVKLPGCELWLKIVERFAGEGKSFFLVGSKPEVIEATVEKLRREYPGIRIAGYRDGYIRSDDERRRLIADIAAKRPDAVFVAMGSPKQELLIADMLAVRPAVYMGLGGSFDVYVGAVRRAPRWWVDHGLEWAYRLLCQPSRIRRQIHLIRFLYLLKTGRI